MRYLYIAFSAVWLLLLAHRTATAQTDSAVASATMPATHALPGTTNDAMEEVMVIGERAGPRLWRVSKDDHVLWILGTLQPLPKAMVWQSSEVAQVIAASQQVIGGASLKPQVSIFGMLPLYLQLRRVSKLPDQQTLQQVLSSDLYQRYTAVKQRYAVNDPELERMRPIVAAGKLYQDVVATLGLVAKNDVQAAVVKLAKQHSVAVRELTIKVAEPREVLKQLDQLPRAAEVACLEATLARLESDMQVLRRRAVAWANGDVNVLRQLVNNAQSASCWEAMLSVPRVKAVTEQMKSSWMNALNEALARNKSTLALSPVYDLLGATGVLETLRAAGYRVEGP